MKISYSFICFLLLFSSCKNKTINKPVWINTIDTLKDSSKKLIFSTPHKDWVITLFSFIQPITLKATYKNSYLIINYNNKYGVIEGMAQICLSSHDSTFFYPVYLKNKYHKSLLREYRSPKTVNPDSSLQQQRITFKLDEYRNIIQEKKSKSLFFEEQISLSYKTGTFISIKNNALSSYYVQPGSCTKIPINAFYKKMEKIYLVIAGPLKDRYQNIVADGTIVSFIYNNNGENYRMEVSLLNGFAQAIIPAGNQKKYTLKAEVNNVESEIINLNP